MRTSLFGTKQEAQYEQAIRLQEPLSKDESDPVGNEVLSEDEIALQELCERNAERSCCDG